MFNWLDNLSITQQFSLFFVVCCYCLVMTLLFLSFLRYPFLGWYRGFQSTAVFQILMWIGVMPMILPAIYLYLRRKKKIRSAKFIGNLRSRVFHQPECEYQKKIYSNFERYPLNSFDDACKQKFRACKWCLR